MSRSLILEIDKKQEEAAIQLYRGIIEMSIKEHDESTSKMFRQILKDEEKHYTVFTNLLEMI